MVFTSTINPVIATFGPFQLRYYGILLVAAFLSGYFGFTHFMRKKGFPENRTEWVGLIAMVAMLVGARLFHVVFYGWSYYSAHPVEILEIWKGGIASHGAIAFGIVALWLLAKHEKKHWAFFSDPASIVAPAAGMFIRIGNFFNGELVGRIANVPWAVKFPCCPGYRHPVQLYEAFAYLLVFLVMYAAYRRHGLKFDGFYTWLFLLTYGIARFIVEFFKAYLVFSGGLTMGQWLSIPLILLGGGMLAWRYARRKRG